MKSSPCKDCPERFLACSDKCPKDLRGEVGYKTWLAEVHAEKARRTEQLKLMHEDSVRDKRYGFTTKKRR